jgi:endoglucanase
VSPARLAALAAQAHGPSPFAGRRIYRDPWSPARAQARAWRDARPADAALMERIASQPAALWLGDWSGDVRAAAAERVAAARADGSLPVLVAYNVSDRDCGQHSGGGARDAAAYRRWIGRLASGIGAGPAAVVLEPDALAALGCLAPSARAGRTRLIADAVARLTRRPGVAVYIDAGNPTWIAAPEMARRLRAAGVGRARGFAVNVASFSGTAASRSYGRAVSRLVGGAPFVVDTSRNGAGPAAGDEWCNPPGRALGATPTGQTGDPAVDALLWIKRPGESDGACNGGPPAGAWWPDEALRLARAAEG